MALIKKAQRRILLVLSLCFGLAQFLAARPRHHVDERPVGVLRLGATLVSVGAAFPFLRLVPADSLSGSPPDPSSLVTEAPAGISAFAFSCGNGGGGGGAPQGGGASGGEVVLVLTNETGAVVTVHQEICQCGTGVNGTFVQNTNPLNGGIPNPCSTCGFPHSSTPHS